MNSSKRAAALMVFPPPPSPLAALALQTCQNEQAFRELDPVLPGQAPGLAVFGGGPPPVPQCPFGGFAVSGKVQLLSEIVSGINQNQTLPVPDVDLSIPGTQGPLFCFLDNAAAETAGGLGGLARGTLIVDQEWRINRPVLLPPGFTLAGVGIGGAGVIRVVGAPGVKGPFQGDAAVILREDVGLEPARFVVIRDLRIETDVFLAADLPNRQSDLVAGVKFSGAQECYIKNVHIRDYSVGVFFSRAISNWISNCVIDANGSNIVFHRGNFNNHVRDCYLRFARCWGVRCYGAADGPDPYGGMVEANGWGNDFQFVGCDVESNGAGGIMANGFVTLISGCRFEDNGSHVQSLNIFAMLGPSPQAFTSLFGTFEDSGGVKILGNHLAGTPTVASVRSPVDPDDVVRSWPKNGYGVNAAFNMGVAEADDVNVYAFPPAGLPL